MTIDKLIEDYEWAKRKDRNYDFAQHIKRMYMPYAEKEALVRSVVKATSYVDIAGRKVYRRNTSGMLFAFTMHCVARYTDIEFSDDEAMSTYDVLMETGIMNKLMMQIPESELSILRGMLDMQREDLEVNVHSIESFLENNSEAIRMVFDVFGTALEKFLEKPEVQTKIEESMK